MFGSKIKLDKDLLDKIKRLADLAGYSSPEEFITRVEDGEPIQVLDVRAEQTVANGRVDIVPDGVSRRPPCRQPRQAAPPS